MLEYKKSFSSHEKAQYWSNKNELKPHEVSICNGKKFLFDCPNCNHTFKMNLSVIVRGG